ncbi:MAG TPA: DUF1992 domain-containing protein [Planctomycetota bacterium]|nr:DUF1992 domain-containing protein [Planctomycetota bacterium]
MSQKPRHETLADQRIRQLRESGAFENLPGAGKPIPGLDEPYDENWWLKNLLKRENISLLPETLAQRAEIEKEIEALASKQSEADVRAAVETINQKIRKMNSTAHAGPMTTVSEMDAEKIVKLWKARR